MSTTQSTHQTIDHFGDSRRGTSGRTKSYWSWLLFKEAKQLAPLLIALVACSFVLHLFGKFGEQHQQAAMHCVSLMMVPLLFAIGAGPMLVSQEKEQRTLGWIGSLPIDPRSIVLSKLIVCVVGLVLSWVVSAGTTWAFFPSVITPASLGQIHLLAWVGTTFALLSLGLSFAWVFPTAVSSLIALSVFCCLVPYLCMLLIAVCVLAFYGVEAAAGLKFDSLGPFGLIATVVSYAAAVYFGQRALVAGPPTESIFSFERWRGQRRTQQRRSSFWTLSPSSSLIWQTSRQNSLLWAGLLLIIAIGGGGFYYFRLNLPSETDVFLAVLLPCCLVLSWLGASVFGSDAYRNRINFLSQRGVSPGLIWWTRLILPVSIVGLLSVSLFFAIETASIGALARAFAGVGISIVLMIFAFTQWFSQWTRSALIAFCIAPAVAVMVISYQIFVIQALHVPWWILFAPCAVALIATRIMLCPWMDGRFDLRYWFGHGGLLLVALGIPLLPFVYTWATYPDMSPAMKRSLVAEISQYQQSPTPDAVDLLSNRGEPDTEENALNPKSIGESVAEILNSMEQELDSIDGPIAIPGNKIAIKAADLLSLRLDSSNESDDRAKIDRQRYRQVILLLDNLARHLRLSDRIQEQDYADMIERWLVGELSLSGRREMFTDRQYARVVLRLADEDARHQARRRATVMIMFWGEEFTKRTSYQFEKIVATGHQPILAPRWLVTQRDAAILTEILLNRLESAVPEPIAYAGELDGNDFGWWPKIGMLWHRPWEAKAKQLAESFESTPQEKGNIDE